MADDDKDFTFGDSGEDLADDDGWGSLEEDSEGMGGDGDDFDLDLIEQGTPPPVSLASIAPVAEAQPPIGVADDPAAEKVRRSPSRIGLYGLLVMVLSAAGFYYFTTSPSPPVAKAPAPAKQTLAMPERPAPSAMPATPVIEPVAAGSMPAAEAQIPRGTLREVLPTETTTAPAIVEAQPVAPTPAAPALPVAPPEVPAVAVKPLQPAEVVKKKITVASKKPAVAGKYSIQAGAFVEHANRNEALAKISQLGFEGQLIPVKKIMPMTRLLIGVYATDVAKQKVSALAKIVPGAFSLPLGDERAVYAGSFYEIDKARILADELSKQGVSVKEESAEVELTLARVRFGSFPDQATANEAAKRAWAIGLEVEVVGTP